MRRRQALAFVAVTSSVSLARFGAGAQSALPKIRIAGPLSEDATNVYYAIKLGLFQRAGLDVELVGTNSGAAATAALVSGTYEFAKTGMLAILTAHLREIPIVVVAPSLLFTSRNAWARLQIAPDSPLRTGLDLNAKTLGVPSLNDLPSLAIKAWVDKNGGDWRSLKFVEIPNSALEPAIVQHRIDAALIQEPQLDVSLAARSTKTLGDALGAIAPTFLTGAYIAREDWARQHTDVLRRFNSVFSYAADYVGKHATETAPLVSELTKIEISDATMMHRSVIPSTLEASQIQPLVDAAAKYEQIGRSFPARELLS